MCQQTRKLEIISAHPFQPTLEDRTVSVIRSYLINYSSMFLVVVVIGVMSLTGVAEPRGLRVIGQGLTLPKIASFALNLKFLASVEVLDFLGLQVPVLEKEDNSNSVCRTEPSLPLAQQVRLFKRKIFAGSVPPVPLKAATNYLFSDVFYEASTTTSCSGSVDQKIFIFINLQKFGICATPGLVVPLFSVPGVKELSFDKGSFDRLGFLVRSDEENGTKVSFLWKRGRAIAPIVNRCADTVVVEVGMAFSQRVRRLGEETRLKARLLGSGMGRAQN